MADSTRLFGRGESWIVVVPGPDTITTPSLTANLICRVIFGLLANLMCLVPLKNLYRNGEFAAVVFILNIEMSNLNTVISALIWRDDDTDNWWPGYGLCDLNSYTHNLSIALFVTCLLAIMRNLAQQVGLLRANPLTVRERRRRHLVQALIIFPLPIIQLCWVWPLTAQRYVVATLVGCSWVAWPSWPYVVFFIAAPVLVSVMTAGYAVLTFLRFREVARTTRSALSSNRVANQRAQRTKRRLYLMVVSILTPFLPIIITLAVINVMMASPLKPFNYDLIHKHPFPYQWDNIIFLPSNGVGFAYMNNCYISILAAVPVFLFFGMTKDAMNSYRLGLLYFGLGHIFPKLNEEYDPDREAYGSSSGNSRLMDSTTSTSPPRSKLRSFLSSRHNTGLSASSAASTHHVPMQSINLTLTTPDAEQGRELHAYQTPQPSRWEASYPPPTALSSTAINTTADPITLPHRNPFLFRTRLDLPIIPFPSLPSFSFKKKKDKRPQLERGLPLESLPSVVHNPHWDAEVVPAASSRVQTRVWSDEEEACLYGPATSETGLLVPSPLGHTVTIETRLTRETHRR
ncbi:pheromone a factor receptor [Fusarium albosuccineum]|uniref:Pheromone a factor receptor n=1 Tax=Fusarium albosuccineum TaxID=1237068 RepID=A0A8H4P6M7_9HYPO|nr:pheromone a factor receptor [Fusarium albosuccineum]